MIGLIKSYLPEKQYGFIKGNDNNDYFFHASSLKDSTEIDKLKSGLSLSFEQKATPKGYAAINITIVEEENNHRYSTFNNTAGLKYLAPDTIYSSKYNNVKGWEIVGHSDWAIHGSSRYSPDDAKDSMLRSVKSIGANCILNMQYYKTTGSEPGTGRGIHYYTIHNFCGNAVNIAKRSPSGSFKKEDFGNINEKAKLLKSQLISKTTSSKNTKLILWVINLGLIICGATSKTSFGVITAVVLFFIGLIFFRSTDYDSWLEEIK